MNKTFYSIIKTVNLLFLQILGFSVISNSNSNCIIKYF